MNKLGVLVKIERKKDKIKPGPDTHKMLSCKVLEMFLNFRLPRLFVVSLFDSDVTCNPISGNA